MISISKHKVIGEDNDQFYTFFNKSSMCYDISLTWRVIYSPFLLTSILKSFCLGKWETDSNQTSFRLAGHILLYFLVFNYDY